MASPQPTIEIKAYGQIVNLANVQLRPIARTIFSHVNTPHFGGFRTLTIDPLILEYLNIRYAEKQVKGIDENFLDYNLGVRLQPLTPGNPPPAGRSYLPEKAFSGDVSGDIGESVFVYFLTDLGINGMNVGHLRPEKLRRRLTPDFVIWENNTTLANFLRASYTLPLFAEIKSSTGVVGTKRIQDGLEQLQKVTPHGSHGLLFMLQKNTNSIYEGYLVGAIA